MNIKQQKIILNYFNAGYIVMIEDSPIVDSPVKAMYLDIIKGDEVVLYCTEEFEGSSLNDVDEMYVTVSKPIRELKEMTIRYIGEQDETCIENFIYREELESMEGI